METAHDLLKAGDLVGSRASLVQRLREKPDDVSARMFLFQLLAVLGEWEKAESQLRSLTQLAPETQVLAAVCGQCIAAEKARAAAFGGAGQFPILLSSSAWLDDLAGALAAAAAGSIEEATALRDRAFGAVPEFGGTWNEVPFTSLADCDSRFGPSLEAVINGRWGMVALDEIARITSEGPQDLRDIIWLPVEFTFRDGQSGAGFVMARYPGTEAVSDSVLKLARATAWRDGPAGPEGVGQRILFGDDDAEFGLLSLRSLLIN